jgi:hypothetical protein
MFSKYWIVDCAAPSADCTASMGFSTTYRNNNNNNNKNLDSTKHIEHLKSPISFASLNPIVYGVC